MVEEQPPQQDPNKPSTPPLVVKYGDIGSMAAGIPGKSQDQVIKEGGAAYSTPDVPTPPGGTPTKVGNN